jgi:drug/metabolite transporter (DMT)-like permease
MLWGAFSFATMGAMTHALGSRCDWMQIALVRALFMYVAMVSVARLASVRLVVWRPPMLWVRSLSGTSSLVCSFYALTRLPVAEVLTLTNMYPIWIILMSWAAFGQRPTSRDLLAVASGMAGVILIERPRLGHDDFAASLALLSSFFAAIAMLGLHRLRDIDPRAVVAHFAGVATVVVGTVLAWQSTALPGHATAATTATATAVAPAGLPGYDPATLILLCGVGLTGTVGQVFLTRAYAAGMPSEVAVISLTQVIFALIFDITIWGRAMPPIALLGMALILAPTAWIMRRARLTE